jgi:hypothetical protein
MSARGAMETKTAIFEDFLQRPHEYVGPCSAPEAALGVPGGQMSGKQRAMPNEGTHPEVNRPGIRARKATDCIRLDCRDFHQEAPQHPALHAYFTR